MCVSFVCITCVMEGDCKRKVHSLSLRESLVILRPCSVCKLLADEAECSLQPKTTLRQSDNVQMLPEASPALSLVSD